MSKPTEKEIKLNVNLAEKGFHKTLYFNRVRVDRDDGFRLVQFGLVVASDLVDSYSCVMTDEALRHNQDALVKYVAKLGPSDEDGISWKGATAARKTDVIDVVTMSFRGDVSETAFYVFSMCAATRSLAGSTTDLNLPAEPLALLRSTKALQKQLITALYEGI